MSYFVYIIRSETTGKRYIGQTSDLKARLDRHNSKFGKNRYTRKQEGPWTLVYSEELGTRSAAMRRERFLPRPAAYRSRVRVILGFPSVLWLGTDILLPLAEKWGHFVWPGQVIYRTARLPTNWK